jgi:ABC-type glycerol-3-phosphate transport system permease component
MESADKKILNGAAAPPKKSGRKRSGQDTALLAVFYAVAALFALLCLYPFYQALISSFSDETALVREGYKLIPGKFSLDAYRTVFRSGDILVSYGLTVGVAALGTFVSLLITAMAAYALSGKKLKYRNFFNFIYYFTMLFSGGLIPYYILITKYLGLKDNLLVYVLPAAFNVWNMFLLRNFFHDIPEALLESAELDGANERTTAFKIVLPLSLPALATVSLFTALGFWNEWMSSMLYMSDSRYYLLQYHIVRMVNQISAASNLGQSGLAPGMVSVPANTLRLATAIITIGPIVLLYPFLQKYFVAGLRVGAVKG